MTKSIIEEKDPPFYKFERACRLLLEPRDPYPLRIDECRDYVERTFQVLNRKPLWPIRMDVGFGRLTGCCTFKCDSRDEPRTIIALPELRRRPWTAIHEAVHALLPFETPHGPLFAQLCIEAWIQLIGWPREMLYELAAVHNVQLWAE